MKIPKVEIDYKKAIIILIILASIFRIFFISVVKIDEFQYDLGAINLNTSEDYDKLYERDEKVFWAGRHLDYILVIYQIGKLPNTNVMQYYHPPLHHIICASLLKIMDFFPVSSEFKMESLQILPCIYSIIMLIIIWKILEEIEVKDSYKLIALSICAFHPLFIFMSGLLNNDTLVTMFSILSILYIIKWYKNPTYKSAIILAIVMGLGTLTKSSMIVNILIAGIAFLVKLLDSIAKEEFKKMRSIIVQGIVFFVISLPMIFAFPIRNYVLFGQEFFGIADAAEELYVGNDDIPARFGLFNKELLNNQITWKDKNVFAYTVKSAIVFEVYRENIFGTTFVKILSILLIIVSLLTMIKQLFSKNAKTYFLIATSIIWVFAYICFNIQMPNSCTMHARYMATAIFTSAILLSQFLQENCNKKINFAIETLVVGFNIGSILIMILTLI